MYLTVCVCVTDLEERDEKLQTTFKQLELKNLEVQKFRTAAELAKVMSVCVCVGGGVGYAWECVFVCFYVCM